MKKIILFIAISSFLLGACSKDFLDRAPISSMNEMDFFKTEEDFNTAIMAVYRTLHSVYGPGGSVSYYGQLMSDECTIYGHNGTIGEYYDIRDHTIKVSNSNINGFWTTFYTSLFRLNTFLEKAEAANFENKVYQGEVHFLRGLYYFLMVQMWGDVPLVIRTLNVDESYEQGRTPVAEVYTQIISDLEYAVNNLPGKSNVSEKGRICKEAASGMLAKVYMTRNATGDKALAEAALLGIYNEPGIYLVDDYADLWDMNKKNGPESIFEIQYKGGSGNPYSSYWRSFTPHENHGGRFLNGPLAGQFLRAAGAGDNQVTNDLWDAYEPDDPRRDLSIVDGWMTEGGEPRDTRFPGKWIDNNAERVGEVEMCDNNFIVLRYADVLLLLSEVTGDAKYLNEVRSRVGLPLWGDPEYPANLYPTLQDAILHERQVELALEFHRYFDLQRMGKAQQVLQSCSKSISNLQLVWPIPLSVVDQNPNVIKQNSGYTN